MDTKITVTEAAALLQVSPMRVRQLVAAGVIAGQKRARAWFLDAASVRQARRRRGRGRPKVKA